MIELPIVRLREDARLPERAYPGDAGLDLSTCEPLRLEPGEREFLAWATLVGSVTLTIVVWLLAYMVRG